MSNARMGNVLLFLQPAQMNVLHLEKESVLEVMPTEYAGIMTLTHA